ncbi:putative heme oxygenase superfamily protein [Erysiphe neolycopersici]|uniref:Putative heme oxygenase superfamily protein n=1 Tax=Erysiphe neolycopersici TaxID=212602 RepID=A0A420HYG0_9PEZI|nr:putative heme oxygenase superfamily protein [Erysiphe neolycopersici]
MPRPRTHSFLPSLSERINAATRAAHTHLNRLILEHLPLALPPYAHDRSIYASGLLHIASIYLTFEDFWLRTLQPPFLPNWQINCHSLDNLSCREIKSDPRTYAEHDVKSSSTLHNPEISPRIDSALRLLLLPDLARTENLRADLANLLSIKEDEVNERIEAVSKHSPSSKFIYHIRNNVTENPHVLLAYAWVFYMALFSGGRYLNASLKKAGGHGTDFWKQDSSAASRHCENDKKFRPEGPSLIPSQPNENSSSDCSDSSSGTDCPKKIPGLQFFCFAGEADGEDIKMEFKKRFKNAENLLTNNEKLDIILESQYIFKYMIELVLDLDILMGTNEEDENTSQRIKESNSLMKIRDSVFIAKERLLQKAQPQIFKDTWQSMFHRKQEIFFSKRPFTLLRGRSVKFKRCLPKECTANFGKSGLPDINSAYLKSGFSVSLLAGLVFLLLILMAFKMFCSINI